MDYVREFRRRKEKDKLLSSLALSSLPKGYTAMKLYIDTSNSEKVIVGFDGETIEQNSKKEKSQVLLYLIKEELGKRGLGIKDVTQIEVNTGPGSFTGLKVGVSVANALGWSLGVSVNGKVIDKDSPIEPVYSQEIP